jgi:hypothetical protein
MATGTPKTPPYRDEACYTTLVGTSAYTGFVEIVTMDILNPVWSHSTNENSERKRHLYDAWLHSLIACNLVMHIRFATLVHGGEPVCDFEIAEAV